MELASPHQVSVAVNKYLQQSKNATKESFMSLGHRKQLEITFIHLSTLVAQRYPTDICPTARPPQNNNDLFTIYRQLIDAYEMFFVLIQRGGNHLCDLGEEFEITPESMKFFRWLSPEDVAFAFATHMAQTTPFINGEFMFSAEEQKKILIGHLLDETPIGQQQGFAFPTDDDYVAACSDTTLDLYWISLVSIALPCLARRFRKNYSVIEMPGNGLAFRRT